MQSKKDCDCSVSGKHASCREGCKNTNSEKRADLFSTPSGKVYRHIREDQISEDGTETSSDTEDNLIDQFRDMIPKSISSKKKTGTSGSTSRMTTDSDMLKKNRASLRKFEALNIGGQTMTEMSIGGYKVDIEKLAEKAMEVLPLPPSRLPMIFIDEELNFYHHFFQGMTRILGARQLDEIVKSSRHFDDPQRPLLNCLEDLILSGYERSDDEITILLKKVIGGTFETTGRIKRNSDDDELFVAANLWGFEYIEQGMQCSEADLRMWLSMCYNHYKTIWFNTFKSTGVPEFATDGAMKYRSSSSSGSSLYSVTEEVASIGDLNHDHRQRTRSHRRRSSSSVVGSERGSKKTVGNQMTNWLASKPIR